MDKNSMYATVVGSIVGGAVAITLIICCSTYEHHGMSLFEKQAYEKYLDACEARNIDPLPPFKVEVEAEEINE